MKRIIFIIVTFLIQISFLFAQNAQFQASAKQNVTVGERFRLTYILNAQGSGFKSPSIRDFNILSGPNQSSSSSVQFINGQVSQEVNLSFTYILEAVKPGTFTIPPAIIYVNGKEVQSNPISITVGGSGTASNQQNSQNQTSKVKGQNQNTSSDAKDQDLFIKAIVDNSNPYQGQQITLLYKLYTRLSVSQYGINKLSNLNGFWSQDLMNQNDKPKQYNEVINGSQYIVAEIRKVALFPQKSGNLTIEPLEVECVAQVKSKSKGNNVFDNFFNDPFFGNSFFDSYQNVKKTVKSNALTINVKQLPTQGQPADFKGSVGNFTIKSEIDKDKVKANEAINLKIKISGTGNIQLIDKLNFIFPSDFETYDPKVSDNVSTSGSVISGSKTFEYLLIPRNPGNFTIKSTSFTFYDPAKKNYVTLSTPDFNITVLKGDGSKSNVVVSSVNREDIKYIGSDIRYIKTNKFKIYPIDSQFYGSTLFYILLVCPAILFVLFLILWRNQIVRNSNVSKVKYRKATKIAIKRLKTADLLLKNKKENEFYDEIFKALWGYLSDKLSIPQSELSKENVIEVLRKTNTPEEIISEFIDTLNECEFARFAPGDSSAIMDKIYKKAIDIISKIENVLK